MSAQLLPDLYQIWRDSNGAPLAGGSISTYQAGSTTPLATYTDFSALTPNSNPITLDSSGSANVWLGSGAYKFVIKDSLGNVIRTIDNVSYINPSSINKTMIAADVVGSGLGQNGTGSIDVQVDNLTIDISGSNQLEVKPGSITADFLPISSKLEIVTKNVRDYTCPGLIQHIPQYEWSTPSLNTTPALTPTSQSNVAKWSPNGEFLAVGMVLTPYIYVYQRSGTILTKLADPGTVPTGVVKDLTWSPCGDFLAVGIQAASNSDPCCLIYQRTGNSFAAISFTPPAGAAAYTANFVAFSPNSDFLALSFNTSGSSGTKIFQRTGTSFSDVTSTSTISGIANSIAWAPDSSVFAGVDISTGAIDTWSRAGNVFTSITGPNISSYLTDVNAFSFSPDRQFFAVALSVTPFVLIFTLSPSNVFAQLSNPGTLPAGAANCVAWAPNGEYLAVGHATTPYVTIYQISGTTFTKIANLSSLPASAVLSADWSFTKQFLSVTGASPPYLKVYQSASTLPSDALLWVREAPNV